MALGADTTPPRSLECWLDRVSPATAIANGLGKGSPPGAMRCPWTSQRMRDFVQENLGDLLGCGLVGEVSRDRDSPRSVVTLPQPSGGTIESEGPGVGELVEGKQAHCFFFHPPRICHGVRVTGSTLACGDYPQPVAPEEVDKLL